MATHYLQQIFSSFAAPNTTESTTAPAQSSAAPVPSDLLTFLWSFTALRDWLKLAVLGGFFETCRRLFSFFYGKVQDAFFINASFTDEDMSYEWMMAWLAKQPSWHECRDVEISTDSSSASTAVVLDGPDDGPTSYMKSSRKLAYLPSFSRTYSLWYKRRWITIIRTQEQVSYYNKQQTLHLRILSRSKRILIELLQEARNEYLAAQEHSVCIYISDMNQNWRHSACRAKRAMNSVVLDPGIKELLLDDAQDFLDSKPWYAERGIPFRRGYLLYGAPGSGKTSLIHCLAGELGLDVYVISLSRMGMDDAALDSLVNDLPERCIALMEDIDAAFTHGLNRDKKSDGSDPDQPKEASPNAPTSRLSLSGLLNALDGVSAQEGRILIATTNKYTSLDPALCRPGRMDLHIEFKLSSKYQARELFSRFYLPSQTEEKKKDDDETDSGYGSTSDTPESTTPVEDEKPKEEEPVVHGAVHRKRAPKLSRRQVRELADQFAEAIPERELSMASLQGYLMMYKVRPFEAVKDAEAWVEKERQERAKKEQAAKEKEEKERVEKEKKEREEKEKKEKEEKEKKEKEEKEKKEKEEKEKSDKENKPDEKKE